ncbi:MAG: methyltransferase domain-containing protein [Planctomycetes bacterium]|jgi:SAM-dependent methyltransferase|nr:methyltransferase domain-containing protein [Planctomycetota bacterium]MCL4731351.1 methyltransferase domain-containing protein [Planctomycetota bacterium]
MMDTPDRAAQQAPQEISKPGYWNDIYAREGNPRWDLGRFAPPLQRWLQDHRPSPGRVLVPGCGFGHDVRLLAEHGFDALGVDFAPLAMEGARRLHAGVSGASFEQADMFSLLPGQAGAFDYVYEYTCFVAVDPPRRDEYARLIHGLLKPGGLLVGCFYNHGRPGGPPFDATREIVLRHFEPLFRIEKFEVSPHSIERRRGHELWAEFRKA